PIASQPLRCPILETQEPNAADSQPQSVPGRRWRQWVGAGVTLAALLLASGFVLARGSSWWEQQAEDNNAPAAITQPGTPGVACEACQQLGGSPGVPYRAPVEEDEPGPRTTEATEGALRPAASTSPARIETNVAGGDSASLG